MKIFENLRKRVVPTERDKLIETLKKHPVCKPMNDLRESEINGEVRMWLNPHCQHCFNFGWFTIQDFYDWMNGTGAIVMGNTPEQKKKFWDVAVFESQHEMAWSIGYYKKYFDLIDDTYHPEMKPGYGFYREAKTPLKITKTNHAEIISKIMGDICRWYGDTTVELKINSFNYTKMTSELQGVKETLYTLGVGYYGAVNTPEDIENLSWIADICVYKAAYLYFVKNEIPLPDFEFVYSHRYGKGLEEMEEVEIEETKRKPLNDMTLEELEIELQEVWDKGDNTEEEYNMLVLPIEERIKTIVRALPEPKMTDGDSWWTGKNRIKSFPSWQDAMKYWESKQKKNEKDTNKS